MNSIVGEVEQQLRDQAAGLEDQIRIFRSVLDSMGDGVAVVDEHGKFLLYNASAKRIYGREPVDGCLERGAETYGIFHVDGHRPGGGLHPAGITRR